MKSSRELLAAGIAQIADGQKAVQTQIPGLTLHTSVTPTDPVLGMYEPSVCVVAQGAKRVTLGTETYRYDEENYLITSVHLPTIVQIMEASKERPYMGFVLRFDRRKLSQVMADTSIPMPRTPTNGQGMATSTLTEPLMNAFVRLIQLLQEPDSIPVLSPLIEQEIIYRLLMSDAGHRLRGVAAAGSHSQQIARAVEWLKENFKEPLQVSELAEHIGMSTSTFHHHFREMTALSPLQYQKRLRLHEARQLMLVERLDAATAAFQVGYESSSQFSREYSRQFGAPPSSDVKSLLEKAEYANA